MTLPSQGYRELGLTCDRPVEMGESNIFVHSLCLSTDETDRGVDQQDGNNPGCEESDAGKEEMLKMRLPTRSDMICGYACLKGISNSSRNPEAELWAGVFHLADTRYPESPPV